MVILNGAGSKTRFGEDVRVLVACVGGGGVRAVLFFRVSCMMLMFFSECVKCACMGMCERVEVSALVVKRNKCKCAQVCVFGCGRAAMVAELCA